MPQKIRLSELVGVLSIVLLVLERHEALSGKKGSFSLRPGGLDCFVTFWVNAIS